MSATAAALRACAVCRRIRETDHFVAIPPRFRRPRFLILAAAVVVLTATPAGMYLARRPVPPPSIAFSEFVQRVESGAVKRVTFGDHALAVTFRDDSVASTIAPREFLSANASFVNDLVRRQIRVDVEAPAETPVQRERGNPHRRTVPRVRSLCETPRPWPSTAT